jgi:hypothetical protein
MFLNKKIYIINKKYERFKFSVVSEVRCLNPLEIAVAPTCPIELSLNVKLKKIKKIVD